MEPAEQLCRRPAELRDVFWSVQKHGVFVSIAMNVVPGHFVISMQDKAVGFTGLACPLVGGKKEDATVPLRDTMFVYGYHQVYVCASCAIGMFMGIIRRVRASCAIGNYHLFLLHTIWYSFHNYESLLTFFYSVHFFLCKQKNINKLYFFKKINKL
jgi:hypothetical protein